MKVSLLLYALAFVMASAKDVAMIDTQGTQVTINLPGDVSFAFNQDQSIPTGISMDGDAIASGYFHGKTTDEMVTANIITFDDNDRKVASIVDEKNALVYHIAPDADGDMIVTRTGANDFPEEIDPIDGEDGEVDIMTGNRFLRSQPVSSRNLQDDGSILDVLVVWTDKAECRQSNLPKGCSKTVSTESNIRALIDLAVSETNTAYTASGVNTQLRLVHAYKHESFDEDVSGFSNALSQLRSTADGILDDVHPLRTQHGADLVALIIDHSSYCGIAYLGPSKSSMFSVTARTCATGYFSFGHEIGHNLGCNHDRGTSNACSSSNYHYGYRDPNANFRSILAYNCASGQCDQNAGNGCSRVQRFSNNDFLYNGAPIGTPLSDNARKINDVKATVAAYYPSTFGQPTISPVSTGIPTSSPISSPTVPPAQITQIPGTPFYLDDTPRTWTGCNSYATNNGYNLASIRSQSENDVITAFITQNTWIGGYQTSTNVEPAGNWAWADGSAWAYTNWYPGEPNNQGGEDYAEVWLTGEWNDATDSRRRACLYRRPITQIPGTPFYLDYTPRTWTGCNSYATNNGYNLASIRSQSENDVITAFITQNAWIGGYQTSTNVEPAGNWAWADGSAWAYTNWNPGEPNNNSFGGQDHSQIYHFGKWDDANVNDMKLCLYRIVSQTPTSAPSVSPSSSPSVSPSSSPTPFPTLSPISSPTLSPVSTPTPLPTPSSTQTPTTPTTSGPTIHSTDPWLIKNTFASFQGGLIHVSHDINSGPKSASIKLYESDCESDLGANEIIYLNSGPELHQSDNITYSFSLDESKLSSSNIVTFNDDTNTSGSIFFCTKMNTMDSSGLEVASKKVKFDVDFNMANVTFTVDNVGIAQDAAQDVNLDIIFTVSACECDENFSCVSNTYLQGSTAPVLRVCITPSSPNLYVKNMNLELFSGAFSHDSVKYGISGPEFDGLSFILESGHKTMVVARLVEGLFDGSDSISVRGSCLLEVSGNKDSIAEIVPYELGVKIIGNTGTDKMQLGCLQKLFQRFFQ